MSDPQRATQQDHHPNFVRTEQSWEAVRRGELALDDLADAIVVENGPGAGPWRHVEGKDAFLAFVVPFVTFFAGTWQQDGHCIYADDSMSIALVHETGTAPSGDVFDNRAIWISRFGPDGRADRIWTTDLDQESVEEFWRNNPIEAPD